MLLYGGKKMINFRRQLFLIILYYIIAQFAFADSYWYPADVSSNSWGNVNFNDVYSVGEHIWVVGDKGTIIHTENGIDWEVQNSKVYGRLNAVYFDESASRGWVVGDFGVVLHTSDGGNEWEVMDITPHRHLYDIDFVSINRGWIVGEGGIIFHTGDGGESWTSEEIETKDLYAVHFLYSYYGWAMGKEGTILLWNGSTWELQESPTVEDIYDLDFAGSNGWAVGARGTILRFTLTLSQKWKVWEEKPTFSDLNSINFSDELHGWIVGSFGTILNNNKETVFTPDSWKTQGWSGSDRLNAVRALNPNNIWAFGEKGTIIRSTGRKIEQTRIDLLSPASYIPSNMPLFKWDCNNKDLEFIEYILYIDNDKDPYNEPKVVVDTIGRNLTYQLQPPALSEGKYYWGIMIKDGSARATPKEFIVDLSPPSGSIQINDDKEYTNSLSVNLKLSASDLLPDGGNGIGLSKMRFSNDGQTWSDWEPFNTRREEWHLAQYGGDTEDGEKGVYVQFQDGLEHIMEQPARDTIILDTVSPTGSVIINNNAEFTSSTKVTLSLSSTDDKSGMENGEMRFSNNGEIWSDTEPFGTTRNLDLALYGGNSAEGNKTVYVKFRDSAGNWMSETVTDEIILDKTGPSGTMVINDGAEVTKSLLVDLNISASDQSGVISMEFTNGNDQWSVREPYSTEKKNWDLSKYGGNSENGVKTVYVRFIDSVGNITKPTVSANVEYKSQVIISAQISSAFGKDKIKNGDAVNVNGNTEKDLVSIDFAVLDENGDTVSADVNNIQYEPENGEISGSFFLGEVDAGLVSLKVNALDSLGNEGEVISNSIPVDNEPPYDMEMSIDQGEITNSRAVDLTISALDAVEMYLHIDVVDQGNWIPYETKLQDVELTEGDGIKEIRVKFRDDIGNESASIGSQIILDTTIPKGFVTINNDDEITKNPWVMLNLTAIDENGVESYRISSDGERWTEWMGIPDPDSWEYSWDFELEQYGGDPSEGLKTVYVEYMDKAGNISERATDDIYINLKAPTISRIFPKEGEIKEAMNPIGVTVLVKSTRLIIDINLFYRIKGQIEYKKLPMIRLQEDFFSAEIPASDVTVAGVEYYVRATDGLWTVTNPVLDAPALPHSVKVSDTLDPIIEHKSLKRTPVSESPQISAIATDAVGVKFVNLFYRLPGGLDFIKSEMLPDETVSNTYKASIPALDVMGKVEYYIRAEDVSGNSKTSPTRGANQPYVIEFVDVDPPVILHTEIADNQEAGNSVIIGATITDNMIVSSVLLKYKSSGKDESVELEMTSIGDYYRGEVPAEAVKPGEIEYSIIASDESPQSDNAIVTHVFTVVDTTPPSIEVTFVPSQVNIGESMDISATVTDKVKVQSVKIYYTAVDGNQFIPVEMSGEGNNYSASIPGQSDTGEVKLYIYAEDSQGVSSTNPLLNPENSPFVITILDVSAPVIQHAPVTGVREAGISVAIVADVTDDLAVVDVSLHYRVAGQIGFKTTSMLNTGAGNSYVGSIPDTSVIIPGVEYYIKAVDDSSNQTTHPFANHDTLPHSFSVEDTVSPEIIYNPDDMETVLITEPIVLNLEASDLTGIKEVRVYYRRSGQDSFTSLIFDHVDNNEYSIMIPSPSLETEVMYYIQAYDNSGNITTIPAGAPDVSEPYLIEVEDPFPPDPPTRLAAGAAPDGIIILSWYLSASTDVYRYNIYTDNGSGNVDFSSIYDFVDKNTNNWESPSLGAGVYKFAVRAVDESGNEETNTVTVSETADSNPPKSVTELTATSLPNGRIRLDWVLSSSNDAAAYNIYWDNAQVNVDYSKSLARVNDPVKSWTSEELRDGIMYRFVVRCQDYAGNEEQNTTFVSAKADASPPESVVGLHSTTHQIGEWLNETRITVKWLPAEDSGTGLAGYSVLWDNSQRTLPDNTIDVENVVTLGRVLDGDLPDGHYFHIRPVDIAGNWSIDAAHLGPFFIDTQPPNPPTGLKAIAQANGKVNVFWTASISEDVIKYNIYWDSGTGSIDYSIPFDSITSADNVWISPELVDGKSYQFNVRAQDRAGNEEENTQKTAAVADNQPPSIVHEPILGMLEQEIVDVMVQADVSDSSGLDNVVLHYRSRGQTNYTQVNMSATTGDTYQSQIPASAFSSTGLDYYISAVDIAGNLAEISVMTITVSSSIRIPVVSDGETEILVGDSTYLYFPTDSLDDTAELIVTVPRFIPEVQPGLGDHILTREFTLSSRVNKLITFRLNYSNDKLVDEDENRLGLYLWDGTQWDFLTKVNPSSNSAEIRIMKFGILSIIGDYEPPDISQVRPVGYAQSDTTITAWIEENGSGIAPDGVEVTLNNQSVNVPDTALKEDNLVLKLPDLLNPGSYSLRITVTDKAGNQSSATAGFQVEGELALKDIYCYPNPFDPSKVVNFSYTLTEPVKKVILRVFGMDGKKIIEKEGTTDVGKNILQWDCKDEMGDQILSSVYICYIEVEGSEETVTETIKIAGWK
ncbi:hypothetical protein GF312_16370 [Candidatus Poribacteria bacterium]|nr:hypothetical protein [Candidatus Poribacteria bacterium]